MLNVPNEEYLHLKELWKFLKEHMDEKTKRLFAGSVAKVYGHGGTGLSRSITGINVTSIKLGVDQLNGKVEIKPDSQRREGGGRKRITEIYPGIKEELEKLVDPMTKGDPESPLLWTSKSTLKLSAELTDRGYPVSSTCVGELLHELNFSLQANKKTLEGGDHADRNEQFEYIQKSVDRFQEEGKPVISVDSKKKENIGNYKNNGNEYAHKGQPVEVNVYDFPDKELGHAVPYGVYDLVNKTGFVNVGTSYNTAEFAVASIKGWWNNVGKELYPESKQVLITADGGGSNGSRVKLWKKELQKFCNESGLEVTVCHFPPGTSKWNKIEHQLFSQISINWRGRPLTSYEVIVNLIGSTRTRKGLTVRSVLDTNQYEKGKKISDEEMKKINILRHEFHGDWNYTIKPNS